MGKRCAHCAMHDISDNGQRKRPLNRGNGEEPLKNISIYIVIGNGE